MDVISAEAPELSIVITMPTTVPGRTLTRTPERRGTKRPLPEAGWRVRALCGGPNHIPAGAKYDEMSVHIDMLGDVWPRWSASPRHRTAAWKGNDGKADLLR